MTLSDARAQCPVPHDRRLPADGTPLNPSATLAVWRAEAGLTPLVFADDHVGLIATRHAAGQTVLSDPRFTRTPQGRFPLLTPEGSLDLDERGMAALRAGSILDHDGENHQRLRRAIIARFSVKAARSHREAIREIVADALHSFSRKAQPADLTSGYSDVISGKVHARLLGIPDSMVPEYLRRFVIDEETSIQAKFNFVRDVLERKRGDDSDDCLSDLLGSDLDAATVEGLTFTLMVSGRDSVAYMIGTTVLALLQHPDQLALLRAKPDLIDGAVEEFMRVGAMFLTLFPRTAAEDVTVDGIEIAAGTTVAVSPVAINHDGQHFPDPDRFDVTRDAFGHLGFGFGIHGCVGQQVARVEIKEAIMQLIQTLPKLKLVSAEQTETLPFAHQVGAYRVGQVLVAWS